MKYIIMADGKGKRWHNYKNIPKHFIEVNGEKIIERTVRLLNEFDKDSEVIITSHDKRYEINGSKRYEPKHNILEIDRFTNELIEDNICFLYGDTYYSDKAMEKIIKINTDDLLFFGNGKSIVAIKIKDSNVFTKHVENVMFIAPAGQEIAALADGDGAGRVAVHPGPDTDGGGHGQEHIVAAAPQLSLIHISPHGGA